MNRRRFIYDAALGLMVPFASSVLRAQIGPPPAIFSSVAAASGPTFRAAGTWSVDAASAWSITPTLPSGWQIGDIHLMSLMTGHQPATFSPPAGWTQIGTGVESAGAAEFAWFWRRAESGDTDPTVTADGTGTSVFSGVIVGYSNCVGTGTPYEDATTSGPTTSTTPASSTVTATGDNRRAVCMAIIEDNNTWSSGLPPSGWTTRTDQGDNTGTDSRHTIIERNSLVANGADATSVTVGTQAASDIWATLTILLIPA